MSAVIVAVVVIVVTLLMVSSTFLRLTLFARLEQFIIFI